MLEVRSIEAAYRSIAVLHGIDLLVGEGETVAVIGANGAGKTTLMRCISGLLPLKGGDIRFRGESLGKTKAHVRAGQSLIQAPEGRQIFTNLTVEDNLRLGAYLHCGSETDRLRDEMFELFPILKERLRQNAGTLSGGQQQMLAIARALMGRPKCLLLDEPSLGLAPKIVSQIMQVIAGLKQKGISILLVEQNAVAALGVSDRAYVMSTGRITMEGPARDLLHDPKVRHAFLGL